MFPLVLICNDWHTFTSADLTEGNTHLYILEHAESFDDIKLNNLFPWSNEDRKKIIRFRSQSAKTSWCMARVLAFEVLSGVLDEDKRKIIFSIGGYGKPYLIERGIYFNWSHCPSCVALAISPSAEVGCDIEDCMRSLPEIDTLIEEFFTETECDWIHTVHDYESKHRRFLNLFTQKEAYLKAIGVGLSLPLKDVPVHLVESPFHQNDFISFTTGSRNNYLVSLFQTGEKKLSINIKYFRISEVS